MEKTEKYFVASPWRMKVVQREHAVFWLHQTLVENTENVGLEIHQWWFSHKYILLSWINWEIHIVNSSWKSLLTFTVRTDRRNHHGRWRRQRYREGEQFVQGCKAQSSQSPAWRPSLLSYLTMKLLHPFCLFLESLLFIPLVNKKGPIFSFPITHLAASPFLLHFIPNQYYLTTYRSAMMAVISAAWKLQKKLLFVLKLRVTEINSTFENWYRSLCVCVSVWVCVCMWCVCVWVFMYRKNLGG